MRGTLEPAVRAVLPAHVRSRSLALSRPGDRSEREAERLADRARSSTGSLGHDFSRVRIHRDAGAERAARALHARAFTVGEDVYLGRGHETDGRLLAHELAHVMQQAAAGPSIQRQHEGGTEEHGEIDIGSTTRCEGRVDVTERFRQFAADVPGLINRATDLSEPVRRRLRAVFDFVMSEERGVDLGTFNVVCCTQINSFLARGGESVKAYVNTADNEVGITPGVLEDMQAFRSDPQNVNALISVLQTLAHEKRHVTLGRAAQVDTADLRSGVSESAATHAEYRVEEILTTAEEIAIAAAVFREEYLVPLSYQAKLYRMRNMLRHWVTPEEFDRLRTLIIRELRDRYGFAGGCDNSFVIGVVHSMDTGRWHECNPRGGIYRDHPRPGLRYCFEGPHAVCAARATP